MVDGVGKSTRALFAILNKGCLFRVGLFIISCVVAPLDTLMMITTTIIGINVHSTSSVVIVPIIWLYIAVVVVISFSIIVTCIFISLLLVTVSVVYNRAGSSINIAISIVIDGENILFDASLVILYINSNNIPPIMIMNRMYENRNVLCIVTLMRHTIVVCISSISPMAIGCFICVNINLVIVIIDKINFVMSGGGSILFKMLVLGINEMLFTIPIFLLNY